LPWGKNYFWAPTNRIAEFEVKIGAKSGEKQKQNICCNHFSSFSIAIKRVYHLKMHLDKAVTAGGSNNAGVWGRSLKPPEANGSSEAEPPTLRRFFSFFPKIECFLAYFGLDVCL